jgi:predicted GH43/DUF377 family glycosyl hydrolase
MFHRRQTWPCLLWIVALSALLSAADPSGNLNRYSENPLLRNGPEPYDLGKTGPRVVLKTGSGDYRMWYEAVAGDGLTTVGYATSKDGLEWTKRGVILSPSEPWEMEEISPNSVLIEDGIYKLWYHAGGYIRGSRRLGHAKIGLATSTDGIHWTKHAGNPVLDIGSAGSFDDEQVAEPRVFRLGATYRMYYTGRQKSTERTSLGMAVSDDGINWTKHDKNPLLDSDRWGGFWGGAFMRQNGKWHLWHGALSSGKSTLRYMSSVDGITWNDGPANPVLIQNPDLEAADAGLVGDSVSGYLDGSMYRIMYTGFNKNLLGKLGRFEGICLASIRVSDQR